MRILSAVAAFAVTLGFVSAAQAGFEWTPPTAQTPPAVSVPAVEAEPLAPATIPTAPAVAPVAPAPQAAAPAPTAVPMAEPTLKVKTVSTGETAISAPAPGMAMPQNPGLSQPPATAQATLPVTVSVPPEAGATPLEALEAKVGITTPAEEKAPVVETTAKAAPAPAAVEAQPVAEIPPPPAPVIAAAPPKKSGLSINPYPLAQGNKPATAPRAAPAPIDPPGEYATVEGFGSDMALALALREVVPAHYSFSFAKGVNPGYRVSWNGGKPWNQVVRDMVAPLSLTYEIRGNTVVIKPADGTASPDKRAEAAPSAVPMAPPREEKIAASEQASDLPLSQPRRVAPAKQPESAIETASGEEEFKPVPIEVREAPAAKKPQTIQLSSEAPPSADQPRIWEAKQGASLKETLSTWSQQANVPLEWKAGQDYKIDSGVLINGTFANAVKVLFMHGLDPASAPAHSMTGDEGSPARLVIEG